MENKAYKNLYPQGLPEDVEPLVDGFFSELENHLLLPKRYSRAMMADFSAALFYYLNSGVPLEDALHRLDPAKLGGFFSRPPMLWYPLDSAAKVYPLSMKRNSMAVFRLSAYFKEDIVPEILQIALTFTIKRFPCFATTVKNGFFWHYLDAAKVRYSANPETERPCAPLKVSASGSQAFRVLYYGRRLSVEFFHILTDGSGGMVFLATLAAEYQRLMGFEIPCQWPVLNIDEAPPVSESANGFELAEPSATSKGFSDTPAVQMTGDLSAVKPYRIIHFEMNSETLRAAAKKRGASVTVYMLSLMFAATGFATDRRSGDVKIQVPVNLRKYYASETLRNFSMYCSVRLPLLNASDIEGNLPEIAAQLEKKSAKPVMNDMMNAAVSLVRSLRFIPLFVKRPVARAIYGFLGDSVFSNTLSNLGVVTFPEELAERVEKLDFVLGTAETNRASCAMVSFGDTAVFTVTKLTRDPTFEERLLFLMKAEGLDPAVKGSEPYES